MNIILISYKTNMRVNYLLLLALLAFTTCEYSGLKAAITSDFFKILTKFNFEKYIQNMTLIDTAEASGKYLFNYDVKVENLWITEIVQPSTVEITQETTADGLPQVKVILYNMTIGIQIEHLYAKYGLITENFYDACGVVKITSIEGRYHFTTDGLLVLSEFNVEIEDLTIDVRKDFLNWLIGLFKSLIKSKIDSKLDELGGTISDKVNEIVANELAIEIGWGITVNLTNTMRPNLIRVIKGLLLDKSFFEVLKNMFTKKEIDETITSVITFGMKGSAFPTNDTSTHPDFPPIVDMDFNTDYFKNEVQILLSTYTLDTVLYIAQKIGVLHYTFTNQSHPIFTFNFDTEGISPFIPQYAQKYPDQVQEIEMSVNISPDNHQRPYIEMDDTQGKLVANFNLDFSSNGNKDLSLNVSAELPFTIQVKSDLMTINWGELEITKLEQIANELGITEEELIAAIKDMFTKYVIKFLKTYTKNLALPAILSLITGMKFKNFKLETHEGYLLVSIAVNLD